MRSYTKKDCAITSGFMLGVRYTYLSVVDGKTISRTEYGYIAWYGDWHITTDWQRAVHCYTKSSARKTLELWSGDKKFMDFVRDMNISHVWVCRIHLTDYYPLGIWLDGKENKNEKDGV